MAELVAGATGRLPLKSENVLVGRRSDDGRFVPDVDLADLEGGRTVSRRHARVFLQDGRWYLRVEPTIVNQTIVGGRTLEAGEESALNDGDEIRLGGVAVVFRAESTVIEPALPPVPETPPPPAIVTAAELRAVEGENRVFPLQAADGQILTLGRHSEDWSYKPDVDIADVLYGKTVSRHHGLLYHHAGQWFLKVEAAVTNPTMLADSLGKEWRQLALGEEVPLSDGNVLQLGRALVTFDQKVLYEQVGEIIEVKVEPTHVVVDPGREVSLAITVINHTGHVDWFKVEVEGIPKGWYKVIAPDQTSGESAQVQLFNTPLHGKVAADAVAKMRLVIAPPRESASRAGTYPLSISATSQGEPPQRRATTGQLDVTKFEGLTLSIEPASIHGTRGTYQVRLENTGNDLATIALTLGGTDDSTTSDIVKSVWSAAHGQSNERLKTTWRKPLPDGVLPLANGAKDVLTLDAKVVRRHWLGMERNLKVRVTAQAGAMTAQKQSDLVVAPIVPYWLQTLQQRVMGFVAPILMLVTFIGVLLVTYLVLIKAPDPQMQIDPGATVAQGQPLSVKWNIQGTGTVTLEPNPDPNKPMAVPQGSLPLPTDKAGSQHYVLTSHGRFGILSTQYPFDVNVLPAAKIDSFDVQPLHIAKEGTAVKISWAVSGATAITITPDDEIKGQKLPTDKGDVTVHPKTAKTTYTLTAQGAKGTQPATSQKDVVVDPPTLTSLTADSPSVIRGNQVTLSWQGDSYTKLTLSADKGDLSKKAQDLAADATSAAVKPTETTTYTLTAANAGGSVQKQVQVTVSGVTISAFDANPKKITKGQSATLTWQVTGATKIEIQPDVGVVPSNQTSVPVNPQATTAYTLIATGPDGATVKSQPVSIAVGLGAASGTMAGPTTATKGEPATLAYTYQNAKHIQIKGSDGKTVVDSNVGSPNGTGTITVKPDQTTVYTLVVTGDDGTAVPAQPFTLTIVAPTPTPAPTPTTAPPTPVPPAPAPQSPPQPAPQSPAQQAPAN